MTGHPWHVAAMFLVFLGMLCLGLPVAWALAGTGLGFVVLGMASDAWLGTTTGVDLSYLGLAVSRIQQLVENELLVAVPMFILMGLLLERAGIAERMLRSMQELFGPMRGGLAISVALIGIILAAATGIVGASVVLLTVLALPVMLEQGYDKGVAAGTIAATGTLGILIPPSIMLVIMGDNAQVPVGDLFLGALLPGLLLGATYILYLLLLGLVKPSSMPLPATRRPLSWKAGVAVLRDLAPVLALVGLVLGSSASGMATTTEASGVGALGALALAAWSRKLSWAGLHQVSRDALRTTGMVFGILVGASVFSLVLRGFGGDEVIAGLLGELGGGPWVLILLLLLATFLLGFLLDWIEITLIALPLVVPLVRDLPTTMLVPDQDAATALQASVEHPVLLWFLVVLAVTLQTSFLTPPVGFSLFYMHGAAPSLRLSDIYRGVVPFILLQLLVVMSVLCWPQLVLWLPSLR